MSASVSTHLVRRFGNPKPCNYTPKAAYISSSIREIANVFDIHIDIVTPNHSMPSGKPHSRVILFIIISNHRRSVSILLEQWLAQRTLSSPTAVVNDAWYFQNQWIGLCVRENSLVTLDGSFNPIGITFASVVSGETTHRRLSQCHPLRFARLMVRPS